MDTLGLFGKFKRKVEKKRKKMEKKRGSRRRRSKNTYREPLRDFGQHTTTARRVPHEAQVLADALDQGQRGIPGGQLERLLDDVVRVLVLR